jgi:hypothetical protein
MIEIGRQLLLSDDLYILALRGSESLALGLFSSVCSRIAELFSLFSYWIFQL